MDPVTIVGLVQGSITLAAKCGSAVRSLNNVAGQYKYAKLTISSMVQNLDIMQFAWDRTGTWLKDDYMPTDEDDFAQRLERFLEAGSLVMDALEEDLRSYDISNLTFAQRSRLVFNENIFQGHQNRIRDQAQTMGLLLQAIQLPTAQATRDLLRQSKKQFMKSDESAFSIVPSRLSSRLSISTSQSSRSNSISDYVSMIYQRLSFEDDLFTARVYKRNYRNTRLQRLRRKDFDLEQNEVTKISDSDNDTIYPGGKRRQNRSIAEKKVGRSTDGRNDTDLPAKTAERITNGDVGQHVAHGITVNTTQSTTTDQHFDDMEYHVGASAIKNDGLHNRPTHRTGGDFYADFFHACGRGNNNLVKRQLAMAPLILGSYTSSLLHFCPIYATVSNGHVEVMQTLLKVAQYGRFVGQVVEKPIGGIEDDVCRPLHVATMKGNLAMVELLLEKGASPNSRTDFGHRAVHLAARIGSVEILTALINAGAETDCTDGYGLQPQDYTSEPAIKECLRWSFRGLDDAIRSGSSSIVETFVARGFDPNRCRSDGGNGLHTFFSRYYTFGSRDNLADKRILQVLLDHIDIFAEDEHGKSGLDTLIQFGARESLNVTIELAWLVWESLAEHKKMELRMRLTRKAEQENQKENREILSNIGSKDYSWIGWWLSIRVQEPYLWVPH